VVVKVEFQLGEMFSRVPIHRDQPGDGQSGCGPFLHKRGTAEQWNQRRQAGGEDDAAELPLFGALHTDGGRVYVMGRPGSQNGNPGYLGSCAHSEPTIRTLWRNLWPINYRFVGRERAVLVHRYPRDRLEIRANTCCKPWGFTELMLLLILGAYICGYHSCSGRIWGRLLDPRPLASIVFASREVAFTLRWRMTSAFLFLVALFGSVSLLVKEPTILARSFIVFSSRFGHSPGC